MQEVKCNRCPAVLHRKHIRPNIEILCRSCRAKKFYHERGGKGYSQNYKQTHPEQVKLNFQKYYKRNKEKFVISTRNSAYKALYGISLEQYNSLLEKQGGVCAICKGVPTVKGHKNLCVDHDHSTGVVRGLLCKPCNTAIGFLKETPKIVQSALSYLLKHQGDKSWDRYFLNLAALVSTRSKDPSTQVGAVIVKDKTIISTGYNGLARGIDDEKLKTFTKEQKYIWMIHAERNAILNAARIGTSTDNSTIYVTPLYPCTRCTDTIIQAGIKRVVIQNLVMKEKWTKEFEISKQMLEEAGIEFEILD